LGIYTETITEKIISENEVCIALFGYIYPNLYFSFWVLLFLRFSFSFSGLIFFCVLMFCISFGAFFVVFVFFFFNFALNCFHPVSVMFLKMWEQRKSDLDIKLFKHVFGKTKTFVSE